MGRAEENARRRWYYQEHREKLLEQKKQYYQKHKEVRKTASHQYRQEHKEECRVYHRQYRQEHKEQHREGGRRYWAKLKLEVLTHYSNGKLKCARCGFDNNINGLTIDHIKGGGLTHLRVLGIRGGRFYCWLRKNNYPKGFQVLCGTCQLIKAIEEDKWSRK